MEALEGNQFNRKPRRYVMKIHLLLACLILAAFHSTLAMPGEPKLLESMDAVKELRQCPSPVTARYCPAHRPADCVGNDLLESLSDFFPRATVGVRPVCAAATEQARQS